MRKVGPIKKQEVNQAKGQEKNLIHQNNILIVIPVYNHIATIYDVASCCLKYFPEVLVVDDGSREDVSAKLAGLDVKIVRHERNRGKGQAILTAVSYAIENNKTHILTIDADGQHYPKNIPDFIESVNSNPDAIIIGVRQFNSDVPFSSRFGRSFGNFWVRMQTGFKSHDIQSGYRVYPVLVLEKIKFMFRTFAFENEVIVKALWAGVSIKEIDVSVFYPDNNKRVTHFHKIRDNIKLTVLNTYLTIRAVTPWPHYQIKYENGTFYDVRHPIKILKELLVRSNTPMKLALSSSLGVLLGALPLIACHTLVIIYITSLLRLNKIISIATSHICMPPLVPAICIEVGYFLRFGKFLTFENISSLSEVSFLELGHMGLQRLAEWFIGALVVGPLLALVIGVIVFVLSHNAQKTLLWMQKKRM